jgi:hypothetical protein
MTRTQRLLAMAVGMCLLSACGDPLSTDDAPSADVMDAGVLSLRGPGSNDFQAHGGDGGAPLQLRTGVITAMRLRTSNVVHELSLRAYYPVHGDNIRRGEPLVEVGPFGDDAGVEGPWQACIDGWAAVGLQGNASAQVERLGLICSNLQNPKQLQTLPALGGTGGAYFNDQCKEDELMTGLDLRYGDAIDSVRIYCQKK